MDLINDIVAKRGGDLIRTLTQYGGFTPDKAEAFVPEASKSVISAVTAHAGDMDLSNLASSANVASVLKHVDIAQLAGRTGVTAEQGSKGLSAILPLLLGFIGEQGDAGSLLGLVGKAKGLGDTLDGIKSFGKLFG